MKSIDTFNSKKHIDFISKIPQHVQRSEGWFAARKLHLTSSDAATALGLNPYCKPVELLFKKCGVGKPFTGNEATLHGQKYEDEAIEKYEFLMGKKNTDFGMIPYAALDATRLSGDRECKHLINSKYTFLGGSPDGIAEDTDNKEDLIMLEVKCPMRRKIKHGQIPEHYYPQVQLNMFILNLKLADFIEYIPGDGKNKTEINIVRVHRDEEWFNKHVPTLITFWDSVLEWRDKDITTHPEYIKYAHNSEAFKPLEPAPEFLFIDDEDSSPLKTSQYKLIFL